MDVLDLVNLGWSGIALLILHVMAIGILLSAERRQPGATFAWLLALIFLPIAGLILFFFLSGTRLRKIRGEASNAVRTTADLLHQEGVLAWMKGSANDEAPEFNGTKNFIALAQKLSLTPATSGNAVTLLNNAAATYRVFIEEIESAEHHIHLLFYIFRADSTGTVIRDRLVKAAQKGVQVRVLVDAIGSNEIPTHFWDPLIAAGGQVSIFRPIWKILSLFRRDDRIDYRNHRKIIVVDGKVGLTGGMNIGKEYLGLDPLHGKWRDTHIRIEGPAVLALQGTFIEDWYYSTQSLLEDASFFPMPPHENEGAMVQVIDSGPDRRWSPIEYALAQLLSDAQHRIWITNPYFVPNAVIESALMAASLRGVDVRIMLPARADHLIVQYASQSYFGRMLAAGIRIFQYDRAFLHAKTMLIDDWAGTVGSANMDMRSFHLNFELNAFVFDSVFVSQLAEQYGRDLAHCTEITATTTSPTKRLAQRIAYLLSPLL